MTKIFFLILITLLTFGCKTDQPADDSIPLWDSTFSEIGLDSKFYEIAVDKSDNYDSAQFKVARDYFVSGKVCCESYTDSINGIRYEKNYRPDGSLSEEGAMNIDGRYHVDTWKYYYPDGRTKEINFDSTKQISYYKAIQIAESHNYNKGRLEISEELIEGTYYWKVIDWIKENSMEGNGKYILIRRSNGKITIPQPNEIKYLI